MLELFVIFSKSGIVLFATVHQSLEQVVNGLVKHVFLEERTGQFQTDQLQIKYHLDNEFELVFVVGYQKFLQLSYVDKFIDDVHLAFRDKFSDFDLKTILNISFNKQTSKLLKVLNSTTNTNFAVETTQKASKKQKRLEFCDLPIDDGTSVLDFIKEFGATYENCVKNYSSMPKQNDVMRTFQNSVKSKKTIASMIQSNQLSAKEQPSSKPQPPAAKQPVVEAPMPKGSENLPPSIGGFKPPASILSKLANRQSMGDTKVVKKAKKEPAESSKKGKAARQWDLSGSNPDEFDFSKKSAASDVPSAEDRDINEVNSASMNKNIASAGDMQTNLQMTDTESSSDEDEDEDEQNEDAKVAGKASKSSYLGSIWKNISYNKVLTEEDLRPVLDQLRDHLTAKNVAAQIADDLCTNVGDKLKGVHINTWVNLKKFAKEALQESILTILNPNKTINILREVQTKAQPPYVIVFCGVNGVGKSTNLAKIANWLIINNVKVLVVAGDTFRAGAIEQLKTHVMALKSLHERGKNAAVKIELFERGYNRDTDGVAREAINHARANNFNCVLVDTAGRMQDNEPLMKQLAKLIKGNSPDLTLFVGEALVGNEAVDQLTRFNNSLVDNGCRLPDNPRSALNGIVLTKFDTIDDQVGAAISMTYVTGQPIVFVGVGQTYRDLKQLDAKAVTRALMR